MCRRQFPPRRRRKLARWSTSLPKRSDLRSRRAARELQNMWQRLRATSKGRLLPRSRPLRSLQGRLPSNHKVQNGKRLVRHAPEGRRQIPGVRMGISRIAWHRRRHGWRCRTIGTIPWACTDLEPSVMRKHLLLSWFLVFPASGIAQPLAWQKYTLSETGASVDVPSSIFSKDAGPTEQGHGRRFMSQDGHATFAFQSIRNSASDSPAEFLAKK